MAFDPDAYLQASSGGFDPDAYLEKKKEPEWSDLPGNAVEELKGFGKMGLKAAKGVIDPANIVESAMEGSLQPTKDYLTEGARGLARVPGAIYNDIKDTVTHPRDTLIKRPISTVMNVAGGIGLVGKGIGLLGKAGRAAEVGNVAEEAASVGSVAPEAATQGFRSAVKLRGKTYIGEPGEMHPDVVRKMAEAEGVPESEMLDTVSKIGDQGFTQGEKFLTRQEASAATGVPGEAASMRAAGKMNEAPDVPPAPQIGADAVTEGIMGAADKAKTAIKGPMDEVREILESKYQKASEKPGFKDVLGDKMIRNAQGMRFREMGGTPGQARVLVQKIGEDGLRELMDVAKEKGITSSPVGFRRRQATAALEQSSGRAIGGIRELASKRGAVHDANSIVNRIRERLDSDYLGKGTASGQKGAYMKALEDIKSAASSPDLLAKKISEMNRMATKNKMTQPTGAITDVANEASRLNNELIKKHLAPKEIEFYDQSLRDFGASKIFKKLQSFEVGREMGGRAGVGGLFRNLKQGAMDLGGNKVLENFYDKFGPKLKSDPNLTKNLASLSEGAIEDLLSSLDEAIDEVVR